MDNAYVRSTKDVLAYFQVVEESGLSDSAVAASLAKHGKNGKIQAM